MSTPPVTAVGWYPDPNDPGEQRYWNGRRWTDALAPLLEAPFASPVDFAADDHDDYLPRRIEE